MFDIGRVPAAPKVLMLSSSDAAAGAIASQLCEQGFVVSLERRGTVDIATAVEDCDVVLIDQVTAPVPYPFDIATMTQPVLVIGADSSADICDAFARGVVDYITPPPRMRELASRIRAALRRDAYEGASGPAPIADIDLRERAWEGHALDLSEHEERLLSLLASNPGHVVTRTELARRIWGSEVDPRVIADHMRRLRTKLANADDCPIEITLVRGVGYRVSHA